MPNKTDYLEQYSAAVRAKNTYDAIVRDIRDERQQLQALNQLIQSERNTLAQLESGFATQGTEQGLASEILKATYSSEAMAAQIAAQTKAAGAQAVAVPGELVAMVNQARERRAGPITAADANQAGMLAVSLLGRRDRPMTQQAADATLAYLEALPNLPAGTLQRARQAAGRVADRPTRGPGAPALTPEQAAQEAGRQRALAVYHSSPQGYVGAFEGEAEARKRKSTTAPADTAFATADDALSAYLDMLEDGVASADELARITGRTAEEAERDFRYAKGVYADAKAKGAYQNRQKKYFEPSWLSQAARVSQLERQLREATPEEQRSVTEEAARRVLQERGLDPDDIYLQFRGTPKYDYLRTADRIFGEVDDVVAATDTQKKVAELLDLYDRSGVDWKLDDLASELSKTLSGADLVEAVGFGMAYDRQKREGLKPPDQRKLQAEEEARIEAAKRTAAEARRAAQADYEAAQRERDAVEADLSRDIGRRLATGEEQAASVATRYARLRAKGLSAEEARVHADPSYIPPSNVGAAPEPQLEDFTLSGEVAPVEDFQLSGTVAPVEEGPEDKPDTEMTIDELVRKYGG
jgi:hypothetical protein